MEGAEDLEPYMKTGLALLRRTTDPNSMKKMLEHYEAAIREQYGDRRPTNAAKDLPVPAALLSKGQVETIFDDNSSSSSSSSIPVETTSISVVEVCSSPPPNTTLEQANSDPVINMNSDSVMEAYSCCACGNTHVNMGNSLVECLGCHSIYHQNCHTPPITQINLNDPRIVWYCSACKQKDSQIADSRSSGNESKKSSSKSTSGSKSETSSNMSPSKSISSSANSSPKHYPSTSSTIMYAMEKRVQMMKKKAAKKSEKKK